MQITSNLHPTHIIQSVIGFLIICAYSLVGPERFPRVQGCLLGVCQASLLRNTFIANIHLQITYNMIWSWIPPVITWQCHSAGNVIWFDFSAWRCSHGVKHDTDTLHITLFPPCWFSSMLKVHQAYHTLNIKMMSMLFPDHTLLTVMLVVLWRIAFLSGS